MCIFLEVFLFFCFFRAMTFAAWTVGGVFSATSTLLSEVVSNGFLRDTRLGFDVRSS